MPRKTVSVDLLPKGHPQKRIANAALVQDKRLREKAIKLGAKFGMSGVTLDGATQDSFVNFAQKLGVGADNALSTAGYGFNPITRVRTTLEWIHRGSWLGGQAVDVPADDMTRAGVELKGDIKPADAQKIETAAQQMGIWELLGSTIKWARLYGGALGVMIVDGQDFKTPLRIETIGKGQFKGIASLDRWMVDSDLSNIVRDPGPCLGLPKFYTVLADGPLLPAQKIHYTRVVRMVGVQLPYWQSVMENLWGASELERIYDRMIAFDSATTGAAQLVYKAYIRTYKLKNLREAISIGGDAMLGVIQMVEMMRRFQGQEGITLLDLEDEFTEHSNASFSGLSDALTQFGQQLAGALQIPLVRLFGQSPAGFSTGDADLKNYYDSIKQRQERDLRRPVTDIYRCIAASEGVRLKDNFTIEFRPLWQPSDKEKAETAEVVARAVQSVNDSGLISDKVALEELRKASEQTGVFTNISDEDINNADEIAAPKAPMGGAFGSEEPGEGAEGLEESSGEPETPKEKKAPTSPRTKAKVKDYENLGIEAVAQMKGLHNLNVVVENPAGTVRQGYNWEVIMPAAYGYLAGTTGRDGQGLDVFVGKSYGSDLVVVINQRKVAPDGDQNAALVEPHEFDEHKLMLGFATPADAINTYLAGYTDGMGWKRIGGLVIWTMDELKAWLATGLTLDPAEQNFK